MKPIILLLTCANIKEANTIAEVLLEKRLIVCAKKINCNSSSLWKGKIERTNEILVLMESIESRFTQIEKEVRKIHSYETFVLSSVPVKKSSKGVSAWLKNEL